MVTAAATGFTSVDWVDCTRFLRADIAGVAVDADSAGTVVAELIAVPITNGVLLGASFVSGFPAF